MKECRVQFEIMQLEQASLRNELMTKTQDRRVRQAEVWVFRTEWRAWAKLGQELACPGLEPLQWCGWDPQGWAHRSRMRCCRML